MKNAPKSRQHQESVSSCPGDSSLVAGAAAGYSQGRAATVQVAAADEVAVPSFANERLLPSSLGS